MASATEPLVTIPKFVDDATVQERIEVYLTAELTRQMDTFRQELGVRNSKLIEQEIAKIKKAFEPPKPEDIQRLLEQEYVTFTVKVPWPGEDAPREFTIRELPQSVEKKFYKQLKEKLLPRAQDLAALSFKLLDGKAEDKIKSLLDAFDQTFDILADTIVLILDPRGKNDQVTREWVQEHISSGRQWHIIEAQAEANRLRDFFSSLSLTIGGSAKTMMR